MPRDFDYIPEDTTPTTKPDVLSLEGLAAWLETQPPERTYCYTNTGGCLVYEYLEHLSADVLSVGGTGWTDRKHARHPFPAYAAQVISREPHTFGAALSRCRTAMKG